LHRRLDGLAASVSLPSCLRTRSYSTLALLARR
jgi:hypothetical protein